MGVPVNTALGSIKSPTFWFAIGIGLLHLLSKADKCTDPAWLAALKWGLVLGLLGLVIFLNFKEEWAARKEEKDADKA
jgi:hypothetical protein